MPRRHGSPRPRPALLAAVAALLLAAVAAQGAAPPAPAPPVTAAAVVKPQAAAIADGLAAPAQPEPAEPLEEGDEAAFEAPPIFDSLPAGAAPGAGAPAAPGAPQPGSGVSELCGDLGQPLDGAAYTACSSQGWLAGEGLVQFFTFDVDPSAGPFDVRLMLEVVGGHATMDLWLPGEAPADVPPRYTAADLLLGYMSQESFIRVRAAAISANAGHFTVRVAAERGAPRFAVSLAVAPSRVRLAEGDRDAVGQIFADCCGESPSYTAGPCKTLQDALGAAAARAGPYAASGSLCHADASLCDDKGHLLELVLRHPAPGGAGGLRCPQLSAGFAALPALQRLTIEGSDLGADVPDVARALAPARALEWLVLRRAGISGPLRCEMVMEGLRVLDVSHNAIEGPVPECFLASPRLAHLYMADNRLSGPLPPVGAQSVLNFLSAGRQAPSAGFTSLPPNLGTAAALSFLDVSGSRIAGSLGPLHANMKFLNVSFNEITGPLPAIPAGMTHFDAAANKLQGGLPRDLSAAASLLVLNISFNPTLGPTELPKTMPPALRSLSAADAGLTGPLTPAALVPSLWHLDVARNRLEGPLPGAGGGEGGVILLEAADLSANAFSGPLPPSFTASPLLRYLNVSGNALSAVSEPGGWDTPQLVTLDASRNGLQGALPARLAQQRRLAFIDLSHNSLSSGLAEFAADLTPDQLTGAYFDVSDNQLSGALPPGLRNLAAFNPALMPLYPTAAFHGGTIGKAFDVSGNMLSGPLPAFLWTELPAAAAAACPPALGAGACPLMRVGLRGPKQAFACPPGPITPEQAPTYTPDEEMAMQQLLVSCSDPASGAVMEAMSVITGRPESLDDAAVGIVAAIRDDGGFALPWEVPAAAAGGGSRRKLGAGVIAGIVVGVVAAVVLVGGIGFVIGQRRQISVRLQRFEKFEDAVGGDTDPAAAAGGGAALTTTGGGGPAAAAAA
ncbi:MAG: hypothetical protein J3K34DRAFT_518718 [Monoraphidium minutum]|nr:MAG: hypothetical protein J3K34DRAFT_518718 [Monoraphidium minutum]